MRPGDLFLIFLIWYAVVRFALETLRMGNWTFFGIPTAMVVSAVVIVGSLRRARDPAPARRGREPWGEPPPEEELDDDEESIDDDERGPAMTSRGRGAGDDGDETATTPTTPTGDAAEAATELPDGPTDRADDTGDLRAEPDGRPAAPSRLPRGRRRAAVAALVARGPRARAARTARARAWPGWAASPRRGPRSCTGSCGWSRGS